MFSKVSERCRLTSADGSCSSSALSTSTSGPIPTSTPRSSGSTKHQETPGRLQTRQQVTEALSRLHDVPELLAKIDQADRAELYRHLATTLTYKREDGTEKVRLTCTLNGAGQKRVGGAAYPDSDWRFSPWTCRSPLRIASTSQPLPGRMS
jgi:hypothetical protein